MRDETRDDAEISALFEEVYDYDAFDHVEEDTETAWHEAGHAVVCLVTGVHFEYVTIVPRKHDDGHIQYGEVTPPKGTAKADQQHWLRYHIVTSYAGAAAHAHYLRGPLVSASDHGWINTCAAELHPHDVDARQREMDRASRHAVLLVEKHADAIKALADALLRRRTLTYADAQQVVAQALAGRQLGEGVA